MIVIFAGPTLSQQEIEQHIDCVCYPPVCHGDILRLLADKPQAIGIIDGYFEGAASVWHKEILYAMDQGVAVYGSSSMGALRAAELHPFGMIGVGEIFNWYRDGVILDDDEVAVLHGPAEVGFAVASEPMVNIRATLELAEKHKVISQTEKAELITIAKNTFYKKRNWKQLVEDSIQRNTNIPCASNLKTWLDQHSIDLKKNDAIELLKKIQAHKQTTGNLPQSNYHFEWTNVWDNAFNEHTVKPGHSDSLDSDCVKVLDQLRLNPDQYQRYKDKALLAWLCDHRNTLPWAEEDLKSALKTFKSDNQLSSTSEVLTHLKKIDMDETQFIDLLKSSSRVKQAQQAVRDLKFIIVDLLKLDGRYLGFLKNANLKRHALDSAGLNPDEPGVVPPKLLEWYFRQQLESPIPEQLDEHLLAIDMCNKSDFYRLIAADYLYWDNKRK